MLNKEDAIFIETKNSSNRRTYKVYHFKCSECDGPIKSQSNQLKRHSGKCLRCSHLGKPYMFIYNELKNHRNKKVDFSLTYEDMLKLISNPICNYCEETLIYSKSSKNWGKSVSRAYQLDRKDNTKGYSLDNVVSCCWDCNRLKSDRYTYKEFVIISESLKIVRKMRKSDGCEIK